MKMYKGKYEAESVVKPLRICKTSNNKVVTRKRNTEMTNYEKSKLLAAASKYILKQFLLALGLLFAYACIAGMALSILIIMIKPNDPISYIILALCIGYGLLVINCRAFEYIGDKIPPKFW